MRILLQCSYYNSYHGNQCDSNFCTNLRLGPSTTASIATGCTDAIPLKCCELVTSSYNLTIAHKHSRFDPQSDYHLKEVGENNLVHNFYHSNCKGVGTHLVGRKQGGNCCEISLKLWAEKSSRIKSRTKSRIDNLERAESLLLAPNLTQEHATSMRDFCRTGAQSLNDDGQRLKEMANERHQCDYVCVHACVV